MTQQLPPGEFPSRAVVALSWLTRTFAGRALIAGIALKIAAWVGSLMGGGAALLTAIDTLGALAFLVGAFVLGFRLYMAARHRLLWRVRRKLVLSYVFIGVVPGLLMALFFGLAGLLFFLNVSSYMLRVRVASLVEAAQFAAQAASPALERAPSSAALAEVLSRRQSDALSRYPLISFAIVPSEKACGGTGTAVIATVTSGPWSHLDPPPVPEWVPCTGFAGLVAYDVGGQTRVAARALTRPRGLGASLLVDIPLGDEIVRTIHDEMGLTITGYSTGNAVAEAAARGGRPSPQGQNLAVATVAQGEPLGWVAVLDYTDWTTGEMDRLTAGFRLGPAAVYRYLSGPSLEALDNRTFGQILLIVLAAVAGMFLVIQAVAMIMGLTLVRSITGSVHELFAGTERVRRGDFSYKIPIRSRDQLGELAGSFNSMTASIEDLLREKAEKERLEQELLIARSIQMSLLPQGPMRMPGLTLAGHCEPAREVGGDYYDFLPLDDNRMGILIADVAGKGTSAALYMAELKGIVLSLSQQHASPRQLLIDANRIISKHLGSTSFITMTYAVVDLAARTLTFARAGHCPLVYVPGPHNGSRLGQTLTPEGMVVGLQIDTGDSFPRLLEEMTLPLGRGDLFVLYTDGITEAMNTQGDYFGDARLVELAEQHADLACDELRERILREVHAFAGDAAQHDDMTIVLLKIDDL
ncbi:MAG TPA: SpoIIE family protein phosphatase [Vicinamibacterales bacterium]|nr:SpoIIE family protein phosphatase [Vicinamibacterales bacterium]